jgi:hypothetical protein
MNKTIPMYLVDDYPDGAIESRAWVEKIPKTTWHPRDAIAWLEEEIEPPDNMRYIITGESHQRPAGFPVENSDARSIKPLDEYDPCRAEGCVEGRVEIIDKITGPQEHRDWFERQEGYELTPKRKMLIEERGGRITETTRDSCEECYGTGKAGEFIFDSCDPIPWEEAPADHPEALHFWNIELTDDPDVPSYPGPTAPDVSDAQEKMDI